MRPLPSCLSRRALLLSLLSLWPLLQAQAQTPPAAPTTPAQGCAHAAPPQPPHPHPPPHLTADQRQQRLQKALALSPEQARQLDGLLSQAHQQRRPPDEAALARLLSAEQRQRLRELHPAPPPPPPQPNADRGADAGCGKPQRPAMPPQKASGPASPMPAR